MFIAAVIFALAAYSVPGFAFTQDFNAYGTATGPGGIDASSVVFADFTLSTSGPSLQVDAPGYYGAANYELLGSPDLIINFNTAQSAFAIKLRDFAGYGGTETITVYGANDTTVLSTHAISLDGSIFTFTDTGESEAIGAVRLSTISGEYWSGILQCVTNNTSSPVPEPSTMILFGAGLAGLAFYSKRRKSNKA